MNQFINVFVILVIIATIILSRPAEDSIFWSVRDIVIWYKRFIDDILALMKGDDNKAKWFLQRLNQICPGLLRFTFEFSTYSIVFLDIKLIFNRKSKQIDTDIHV